MRFIEPLGRSNKVQHEFRGSLYARPLPSLRSVQWLPAAPLHAWRASKLNKKASSYLLSRRKGSIIGVRELDFRVRNGNGYYLSTMATSIYYNAIYEVRKTITRARRTDNITEEKLCFKYALNGNDDMAKSHDLLVMLG